jgi:hypothetical protein
MRQPRKEYLMSNNKSPNEKRPGENPEGTFHYNPGNMAGKKPADTEQTEKNRDKSAANDETQKRTKP